MLAGLSPRGDCLAKFKIHNSVSSTWYWGLSSDIYLYRQFLDSCDRFNRRAAPATSRKTPAYPA